MSCGYDSCVQMMPAPGSVSQTPQVLTSGTQPINTPSDPPVQITKPELRIRLRKLKETSKDTVASWEVAADEHHQKTTAEQSGPTQGSQPSNQIRRPTRRIRLRKLKEKRKYFVYPKIKGNNRTFCICMEKNDGRKYWQCNRCEEWYHPECLGLSDEPSVFICHECQPKKTPTSNEEENPKQLRPNDDFTDNPSQQADEEWDRKMSIPIINLETTPPFTIEQDADIK
ncbi:uncharacterized protein [Argopecten irradians]|uniref:uncharacterized protein n=1 Tax=Argopecten irradians TaxID=31199 RepID=UPI003721ED05